MTSGRLRAVHRAWRLLPAKPRREAALRLGAALAPRSDRHPAPATAKGAIIVGGFADATGLGASARIMADALERAGVPVLRVTPGQPVPGFPHAEFWPLIFHLNPPVLPWALRRLPRSLLRGRLRIGYVAWELPAAPPLWRHALPFMHRLWTPSSFTASALATVAASPPPRAVPIPLATVPIAPAPLGRAAFDLPEHAVITLVAFDLASSFERKNPLAAIAAHRLAFGDRLDRLLLLKINHPEHFPHDMRRLAEAAAPARNIRIETRTLALADHYALMRNADIVLSLHRSEGFGLVPAEAMLLGRAVVATGWSGNMDYMDSTCAALVTPRLVPAADPRGVFAAPGAVWADPDPAEAASLLGRLADDRDAREAMARRGQDAARRRLGNSVLLTALAEDTRP